MSDNVVARLRTERLKVPGVSLFVIAARNLDDLLDVVERFTATDPLVTWIRDGAKPELVCRYCELDNDTDFVVHAPDCPWLAARRACGMEPAKAEDGDA